MSRFAGRFLVVLCVAALLVLGLQAATASADPPDFSSPDEAYNVLPPGQFGSLPTTVNSRDQLFLYDALTPLKDNVTAATLPNTFKKNVFGLGGLPVKSTRTFPWRRDVRHRLRDRGGPRPPDGHVPRARPRGGAGRSRAERVPARPELPAVQPVAGDRGLPRRAGRPDRGAPERAADHRRHRQLPAGDQRLPDTGRRLRPSVE